MCYTKVEKLEKAARQKVFYKVVRRYGPSQIRSVYTNSILEVGIPMRATNVKPHPQNGHSFMRDFAGWGVFARHHQAVTFMDQASPINLGVVKVSCEDNPRVTVISPTSPGGGVKCYLFDTITILDGGKEV